MDRLQLALIIIGAGVVLFALAAFWVGASGDDWEDTTRSWNKDDAMKKSHGDVPAVPAFDPPRADVALPHAASISRKGR